MKCIHSYRVCRLEFIDETLFKLRLRIIYKEKEIIWLELMKLCEVYVIAILSRISHVFPISWPPVPNLNASHIH